MAYNKEDFKKARNDIVEEATKKLKQEKISFESWSEYFILLRFDFTDIPENGYYNLAMALLGASVICKTTSTNEILEQRRIQLAQLIRTAKEEKKHRDGDINSILHSLIKLAIEKEKNEQVLAQLLIEPEKHSIAKARKYQYPYIGKDGQEYYSQEALTTANEEYNNRMYIKKAEKRYQ